MKDGAIVCNSGHFNVEIDISTPLKAISASRRYAAVEENVDEYVLGRPRASTSSARAGSSTSPLRRGPPRQRHGHELRQPGACPPSTRSRTPTTLEPRVYPVPRDIDEWISTLKLATMGITIDTLTAEQEKYLSSFDMGT